MIDESMDEVMDWIVSGVRPDGDTTASAASAPSPPADAALSVCGLEVGSAFEIVRDHEALRGRWHVVKIDRGPRGTLRAWARRPSSTDYLPLTENQIRDAQDHGWLLMVSDRRRGDRRAGRRGHGGSDRRRRDRRRASSAPPSPADG